MSPAKPSKDKRAAQNRAARAATAARKEAAAAAASGGIAPRAGGGRKSSFSKLTGIFNPKPPAPRSTGGAAGSSSSGARSGPGAGGSVRETLATNRRNQPIGYRAALFSLIASVAVVVVCVVAVKVAVAGDGTIFSRTNTERLTAEWATTALRAASAAPEASAASLARGIDEWVPGWEEQTFAAATWPQSILLVLPVIASFLGFRAVRQRGTSKVVNRALLAMVLGSVLNPQVLQLFLPAVIGLGFAGYQLRKFEMTTAAAARASGGDGEVIDADVVDADVVDAEVIDADVVDDD
jgi:hypothetical protein